MKNIIKWKKCKFLIAKNCNYDSITNVYISYMPQCVFRFKQLGFHH